MFKRKANKPICSENKQTNGSEAESPLRWFSGVPAGPAPQLPENRALLPTGKRTADRSRTFFSSNRWVKDFYLHWKTNTNNNHKLPNPPSAENFFLGTQWTEESCYWSGFPLVQWVKLKECWVVVARAFNPSTGKTGARGSLRVWG